MSTYSLVLTGAPDGLSDAEFSLKSFNGTIYSGQVSHISFQLPKLNNYLSEFISRPNGELLLMVNQVELYRGQQKSFDFHVGSTSQTMSVSGSFLTTEITPKTVSVSPESIANQYDGNRVFNVPGLIGFDPLDSINYDGDIVQIDQVQLLISSGLVRSVLRELVV